MNKSHITLYKKVVDNDFCVGCGSCAYVLDIPMKLNFYGEYNPDFNMVDYNVNRGYLDEEFSKACPFLVPELNEDVLARPLFEKECEYDSKIGFYHSLYAGHIREGEYRKSGTSGGMGTWICTELLRLGKVDAVIHVKPYKERVDGEPYFRYEISKSIEDIIQGAKTRYHVVEISEVMSLVRNTPGKYLFVGLPCICKSVRRLQSIDKIISKRIKYVVSLVCGHLKSVHWTLSLAWGAGIHPSDLEAFQYRSKDPDIPARAYVFRATKKNSGHGQEIIQKNSANVIGGKFNAGALMLNACNYCDDVVGETADLTIGDAWIPRFDHDPSGTNLLIVRNVEFSRVLFSAEKEGRVCLDIVSLKEVVESQSGGFRQRREGLSYRLEKCKGSWAPIKRIKPASIKVSYLRGKIYDRRYYVGLKSKKLFREALDKNDYGVYVQAMANEFKRLRLLEGSSSFFRSVLNKVKRYICSINGRYINGK